MISHNVSRIPDQAPFKFHYLKKDTPANIFCVMVLGTFMASERLLLAGSFFQGPQGGQNRSASKSPKKRVEQSSSSRCVNMKSTSGDLHSLYKSQNSFFKYFLTPISLFRCSYHHHMKSTSGCRQVGMGRSPAQLVDWGSCPMMTTMMMCQINLCRTHAKPCFYCMI